MKRARARAPRAGARRADARELSDPPAAIAPPLLAWYHRHRRDLPWRRDRSPYRTLVSELMLQQTVVATVIPYFERFIARFPDVHALAAAPEDDVLAAWSGLGYYSRARNLHRAARAVVEHHAGELPGDEVQLRELPGVGPYTAAAVAAIAFGRPALALDGNTARVVARLGNVRDAVDRPAVRRRLETIGLPWVPRDRPGDFAEAVMDLGATVCVPRDPRCDACPLTHACQGFRHGRVADIPRKTAKPARRTVSVASVRVVRGDQVMLVRRQQGLLAGTWMLPAREVAAGASPADAAVAALREVGVRAAGVSLIGHIRHVFTHRDVTATVFEATAPVIPRSPRQPGRRWADQAMLADMAVSSFVRKQLRLSPAVAAARTTTRQNRPTAVERRG